MAPYWSLRELSLFGSTRVTCAQIMLRLIPLSTLLVLINSERATRWVTQQTITLMLGKPLSAPGYFDTGNLAQLFASMSPECMRAKEARRIALRALPPAHRECVRWLDRHREEHGLLSNRRLFDPSPRGHGGHGGHGGSGGGPSGRLSKEALCAMLRHAAVPLKLIDALEAEIAISSAASAPRGGDSGARGQGAQHGASGARADWPRVLEHTWRALAAAQLAADCRQVIAELGTKDFELVVRSFAPLIWEPWLRLARRGALDKFARRLMRQVKKLYSRLSSHSKQMPAHELDASIAEFAHAIVDEHAYELLRSVLATTHEAALDDPLCAWLSWCLETHRTCSAPDLAIDVAELLAAGEQSTPDLRARVERCVAAAVAPMVGARNGARDGARDGADCGAAAAVAPMGGRGGGAESLSRGATTEDEDSTDGIAAASTAEHRRTRADELNVLFGWFGEHGMPLAISDEVDASPQPPPQPLPQLPGIYMPRYVYAALRAEKAPTTASSVTPPTAPKIAPTTAPMAEASTAAASHKVSPEAAASHEVPPEAGPEEIPTEAIEAMLPLFEAAVMRLLRRLAFHGDDGWKVAPGARDTTSSETEAAVAVAAAANAAEEAAEMREAAAAAAEEEAWVSRVELAITELEGQAMAAWEHPEERGDGDAREVHTNPRSARPEG